MLRKFWVALLVTVLMGAGLLTSAPHRAAAAEAGPAGAIRLMVNGEAVEPPVPTLNENGRVLVPAGRILAWLGVPSRWFPATQQLMIAGAGHRLILQAGSRNGIHNGQPFAMDVPPRLVDGELYIPARAVAEAAGAAVTWDEESQTVIVDELKDLVETAQAGVHQPVILVHGLNGDASSWGPYEGQQGPSLFGHLVQDLGYQEGRDLFRFEWDSTSATASFVGQAPKLGQLIDQVLADYLAAGYPDAKVTLIGHSAGGVLIRYWAAGDADYGQKVAALVTVGSPHQGAAGAAAYGAQNGWPLSAQMEPDALAKFNQSAASAWLPGVPFVQVGHLQDELVNPSSALGHPAMAGLLDGLMQEARSAAAPGYAVRRAQVGDATVTLLLGHGWPGGAPAGDVHFGMIRDNWRDWFDQVQDTVVRPLTHR